MGNMHLARATAIETGKVRYSTGKPCRRGHMSERYTTNGGCVECVKDKARETQRRINAAVREGRHDAVLQLIRRQEREKLRQAGGPKTEQQAKHYGFKWFNCPREGCMSIVPVGGAACDDGHELLSKEALDLLG